METNYKMIYFIRSSLTHRDVRAQKYIHFLNQENVKFIQWDREDEFHEEDTRYITYKLKARYGKRLKSIFKFLQWNFFLLKTLYKNRSQVEVIQICDLDSFFGSVPFRFLGKKVIFDVYDFFTDSKLSNTSTFIYKLLYQMEMFCLRFVDLLILPLDVRKRHLNFVPKKFFICENVPLINSIKEIGLNLDTNVINVVYAGTLEAENRGLEWIPSFARQLEGKVHFYIAGNGNLFNFFKEASQIYKNITFLGPIPHSEALSLQKKGDLIYGIYRSHLLNNVMAAPNKFYESTYLGTPIVTNAGLMISDLIEKNGIGFVLHESEDALLHFFRKINNERIGIAAKKALTFWDTHYSNYLEMKYRSEYQLHLTRLTSL